MRFTRTGLCVTLGVAVALVGGGCTEEPGPDVASAARPTATAGPPGGGDPLAKELQFVACMREKGISDMPDPVPGDASGRSSVRYALDVMGKGSDMIFQAALDECVSLLPAPPAEPPTADEADRYLIFARCMRENGVPEYPDQIPGETTWFSFVQPGPSPPAPVTDVTRVDGAVVFNLGDPAVAAAFEKCKGNLPSND